MSCLSSWLTTRCCCHPEIHGLRKPNASLRDRKGICLSGVLYTYLYLYLWESMRMRRYETKERILHLAVPWNHLGIFKTIQTSRPPPTQSNWICLGYFFSSEIIQSHSVIPLCSQGWDQYMLPGKVNIGKSKLKKNWLLKYLRYHTTQGIMGEQRLCLAAREGSNREVEALKGRGAGM